MPDKKFPPALVEYGEFKRGQEDARKGVKHKDQGEYYNRGYQSEYELMEAVSAGEFN